MTSGNHSHTSGKHGSYGTFILVACCVAVHIALIWLPQINLEWAFVAAARYFSTGDADLLNRYLELQANTLGMSYLAYLVDTLLPGVDLYYIPRLLSISGIVLLGAALHNVARLLALPMNTTALIALVLLNPLVWTFSGRGTADFLPAALALFSLSWLLDSGRNQLSTAAACVLLGVAITLKYHAAFLLPLLWLHALSQENHSTDQLVSNLVNAGLKTALACLLPAGYLILVKQTLGFWITPPAFQAALEVKLSLAFWLTNLVSYLGYLGLLLLPFTAFTFTRCLFAPRALLLLLAVCATLFATGYTVLTPQGEMNFGPLDQYLNARLVNGALCMLAGLLCLAAIDNIHRTPTTPTTTTTRKDDTKRLLLVLCGACLAYLAILAVSRPSQRYLLFILPITYLLVPQGIEKLRKPLVAATLVAFVTMNVFVGIKQYATGTASDTVVRMLQQQGLLEATDPGIIEGHAGNLFPLDSTRETNYIVVPGKHAEAIMYAEHEALPHIKQSYSVVPKGKQ